MGDFGLGWKQFLFPVVDAEQPYPQMGLSKNFLQNLNI